MLPTEFQFIWESGFSGEDFLEINQSKTRMACGGQPPGQMNQNSVGSILGRFSLKVSHLVPIR
jgi:hypothetical protein